MGRCCPRQCWRTRCTHRACAACWRELRYAHLESLEPDSEEDPPASPKRKVEVQEPLLGEKQAVRRRARRLLRHGHAAASSQELWCFRAARNQLHEETRSPLATRAGVDAHWQCSCSVLRFLRGRVAAAPCCREAALYFEARRRRRRALIARLCIERCGTCAAARFRLGPEQQLQRRPAVVAHEDLAHEQRLVCGGGQRGSDEALHFFSGWCRPVRRPALCKASA